MIRVAERIRVSDESQAAPERFGIPAQRTVTLEICKRTIRGKVPGPSDLIVGHAK